MTSNKFRRAFATVSAFAMLAGTVASPMMSVSAGEVCGETGFTYKALPWQTCELRPAHQEFAIENGALHVSIIKGKGDSGEKWDLQLRHKNLDFKKDHEYIVSFKAKAKRNGLQLFSKIGSINGREEYFGLMTDHMDMGADMGGQWDSPASLTTEYQTFSGTFIPTSDIEDAEWTFYYATGNDANGGGNGQSGDEIWFDDMSIICETCDECDADPMNSYGATNRDYSANVDPDTYKPDGKLVNFISVNQLGYYCKRSKVAVLGDNKGDVLYGASTIDLTNDTYKFDVVDAYSGAVAYTGISDKKKFDKDSADNVCKLDFTEFQTPGTYYIKVGDWRSFDFKISDDIYSDKYGKENDILTNAMNYFYQNRSGIDIEDQYITSGDKLNLSHMGGHKTDTAYVQKIWKNEYISDEEATSTYASSEITATGGWYGSGDNGKYVVGGGISVWTLQNMYERAARTKNGRNKFADGSGTVVIPETGNDIPDVLDEAAYELDWMTNMVVGEDDPTWGKYAGLVYHKIQDRKWTPLAQSPYDYDVEMKHVRIVKPPTFAATLNYAACAAQAARLWKPYDETKAAKYLDEAKKAYNAYKKYWHEASANEEPKEDSLYAPMYQANGGAPYGDTEVRDDAYWAACEIFVSAKKMYDSDADTYYDELSSYKNAFEVSTEIAGGENIDGSHTTLNWGNTAAAGTMTLALNMNLISHEEAGKVQDSIINAAKEYINTEYEQGYGIPYLFDGARPEDIPDLPQDIFINGYPYGSNSMVINNAIVMAYAYDLTHYEKYLNGVTTAMDYLLGTNPLSFSYITGYGTYHERNPYHKYWLYELDKNLPEAPDGVLSGGPNAGLQDPYIRALGFVPGKDDNPSQRCFADSVESWATNSAANEWNSPLAWVVSFLQDEADDPYNHADDIMFGDVDESFSVDLSDLVILRQHLLKDIVLRSNDLKAADCDGNGLVDIADLPRLKQYLMHDKIRLGPKDK